MTGARSTQLPGWPPAKRLTRRALGAMILGFAFAAGAACATAPPAPPPPPPITYEEKLGWILRLEDQRILRDPAAPPPAAPAPAAVRKGAPVPLSAPARDLVLLLKDADARLRRRAALAVGRVGLSEGVAPLVQTLQDADPDVREMVAFGLGLIGDASAVDPLIDALGDATPLVRGRAAEALGFIGDARGAAPIAEMAAAQAQAGGVASIAPDEMGYPLAPAVEAFRLGIYALVRLKAFDALAGVVLDAGGQPTTRWWPVAYALARLEDPRAYPALVTLARSGAPTTTAFALRGLGALKRADALGVVAPILSDPRGNPRVLAAAIRTASQLGEAAAVPALVKLLATPALDPTLRVETVLALGALRAATAQPAILDFLSDRWPTMRAAALEALAQIDQEGFVLVLSALDADPDWSVRARLAAVLGTLDPKTGTPRLLTLLKDSDQRVVAAALRGLAAVRAPQLEQITIELLKSSDPIVRMAAAEQVGTLEPAGGVQALAAAYAASAGDATYVARSAILEALSRYEGVPEARAVLQTALTDREWAVRVRAASLLEALDPSADADTIRPAPMRLEADVYGAGALVAPAVSPHVYLDTAKGTIQIELAVLDAPLTVESFRTLARKGFFNGLQFHRVVPNFVVQTGDPRGDGEGGPGYTLRDELNVRPYLRGTVGMALDWEDTGGSQFFITLSPQPHLDARYTVFGSVIAGMEVVDRLQQWDVIERVRVWDGELMTR